VPTIAGTILQHKRSATAASEPTTGNLQLGELAINTADGYVYLRRKNDAKSIDTVVRLRASSLTGSGENFSFEKILISGSAGQLIDSFPVTEYRTLKYVIQLSYAGDYHSTEILLMHNDEDVHITEYATIYTDMSLGVITANVVDSNIELLISPTYTNTTIKGFRTGVAV